MTKAMEKMRCGVSHYQPYITLFLTGKVCCLVYQCSETSSRVSGKYNVNPTVEDAVRGYLSKFDIKRVCHILV